MNFSESVKQVLLEKIQAMATCPGAFVRNPASDFTRKRKLDFETTIRCLIAMESGNCFHRSTSLSFMVVGLDTFILPFLSRGGISFFTINTVSKKLNLFLKHTL